MKEILFRGKRLDNGEWVEGYFFAVGEEAYIQSPKIAIDGEFEFECYKVDPETVGQYIREKTTNGQKIFEGDKVTFTLPHICILETMTHIRSSRCNFEGETTGVIEVIGNVWDNPELPDSGFK